MSGGPGLLPRPTLIRRPPAGAPPPTKGNDATGNDTAMASGRELPAAPPRLPTSVFESGQGPWFLRPHSTIPRKNCDLPSWSSSGNFRLGWSRCARILHPGAQSTPAQAPLTSLLPAQAVPIRNCVSQ
ncbi:hypothetical protein H920_12345 [Fukomys damarensis]|uniref:Uncharacterized protein n=1 Tax=Fukomys damarensis TaxID=885580 RepID=A0A091D6V6_FUKDA|nr:hypothetical protein H920_12345 [Fukomys damarensis]